MEIAPFIQCLSELQKGLLIVVLSSLNTPEAVIGALKAGARGFISKASNTQVLLGAIKLVLSGGMYLPPEIFLSRPRPFSSSTPPAPRNLGLTDRQTEVLALLMEGKPNKLICRELNVSEGTVKTHVSAILRALNVSNRAQVSYAITQRGAAALANAGAVPAMGDLLQRPPPAQC
jgi:DNA-binding NarL/FixJ family response regulator